jgi:hypothetical protein
MDMTKWIISNPEFESDLINPTLRTSPWVGHRQFSYDLIKFIEPRVIVELGTHYGCSLFAFCQSCKDNNIKSNIIAIDSWEGDPQAGYYGPEVFQIVNKTKMEFFRELNIELKRKYFSEALEEIIDETIDLLHIDGLHTYEAVKEDFESWLPKLSPNGIILFHDIADYTGYGSHKYWEDIKVNYPSFEFQHSWGLGVLFPKGNKHYLSLLDQNIEDKISTYTFKAEYELASIKVCDLEKLSLERFDAINEQSEMIKQRDNVIISQEKLLTERYDIIQKMDKMVKERDDYILNLNEQIGSNEILLLERYDALQKMDQMIKERDTQIKQLEKYLLERDELLEERYEIIKNMDKMIHERDLTIINQKQLVDNRLETIKEMDSMIKERDEVIEGQRKLLDERYAAIQEMNEMIKQRDDVIRNKNQELKN